MLTNRKYRGSRRIAMFTLFIVTLFTGSCSGVLYFEASQEKKESSDLGLSTLLSLLSGNTGSLKLTNDQPVPYFGFQMNLDVMDRLGPLLFNTATPPTVTQYTDVAFITDEESGAAARIILLDAFKGQILYTTEGGGHQSIPERCIKKHYTPSGSARG